MKTTISIFLTVIFYKHVYCYLRVCYYTNWSQYRPSGGKFTPADIDPKLCSHIIYAFGKLEGNTLVPFEWNDDSTEWSVGMYDKVNNMKAANPDLRTLLAVGGWNAGSLPFSDMVATRAFRRQFINSTLHYLRKRKFDGLDMDWEYPARRGGRPEDKANLVLLLAEMKQAFEQESYHTGRPRLLLTAAVPAGKSNIDAGYDIPNVARSLDFINIMTYDLHGSWEPKTGHNSPLFGRTSEGADDAILNMEWAVKYWTQRGAPTHKLIVGIGLYGRSFKLQSPTSNGIGAAAVGAGLAGRYTREPGFMSYYEVCEELKKGATRVWQAEHRAPYLHNGDLWVGYDDEESVVAKVRWMKQNKYGGIMVWSLALDDFSGQFCNKGRYPLLTAINKELGTIPGTSKTPKSVITANIRTVIRNSKASTRPSLPTTSSPALSGLALTLPEMSAPQSFNSLPPIFHTGSEPAIPPPPPPVFKSNSGTSAAVQAIGDLLLHGTTKLSLPKPVSSEQNQMHSGVANTPSQNTQSSSLPVSMNDPGNIATLPIQSNSNVNPFDAAMPPHNDPFPPPMGAGNSNTPLNVLPGMGMQNPIADLLASGGPLIFNNEQPPSFIPSQTASSVLPNLTEAHSHGAFPLEFVHGNNHATHAGLQLTGNLVPEPPLTNTAAQIPPEPAIFPGLPLTNNAAQIPPEPAIFPGPPLTNNAAQIPPEPAIFPGPFLTNTVAQIPPEPAIFQVPTLTNTAAQIPPQPAIFPEPLLTNTAAQIPPQPAIFPAPQQAPAASVIPAAFDMVPLGGVDPAIVLPHSPVSLASGLPSGISQSAWNGLPANGQSPLNGQNSPLVVGSLPVIAPAGPAIIAEPIPPVGISGAPSRVDVPVAAAAHSDIGLASVRPAPPSKPRLNFSFSSSSTSNSSSSSSSSSSNSTKRSRTNLGAGSSSSSLPPTVQDLLRQGPVDILPIPADGNVLSVVDQTQGLVPGGTVEAVIPIDNIDSLAQVLANLQTSIPTAGTVLIPEPRNQLRPETVLRELDIGNILGSNIASPIPVQRRPSRQSNIRILRPSGGNIDNRVSSQIIPRNTVDSRSGRTRFNPPISNPRAEPVNVPQQSQGSRRGRVFPVSATQLRRLVGSLGRETVRGLLRSGRIVFQPSLQRRQIIRRPVTRTRAPSLRNTMLRQRFPARVSPSTRNILSSRFREPLRRNRRVSVDNNTLNRTPIQTTRGRRVNSNRDIFSMLGL